MKIIAVDDERHALAMLQQAIVEVAGDADLTCFTSPSEVLEHAAKHDVEVAFLDIEMPEMNGLFLAKSLKDLRPAANIIFVTSYSEYANKAFSLRASGYVMKPIDPQQVLVELENLRNPIKLDSSKRVRFQCFGGFAMFIEGEPLLISRSKVKELLAYLVHKRGATATSSEIAAILWEDKKYTKSVQSQTRTTIAQLMGLLKDAGVGDIVRKGWNSMAIDVEKVSCDYYEFLEGNVASINTYCGQYLDEYSWAEFTTGYLNDKL